MHRPRIRGITAALAAVVALVALTGCVRTDADLTVSRANTVTGDILILGQLADESEAAQQAVVGQVTAIETRALPGLRDRTGVTAAAVSPEPGWYGTSLELDAVPITDLALGGTPLITRDGDDFVVSGVIDVSTQSDVPAPAAEGEPRPGAPESTVRVSLTFPGVIEEVRGSAELAEVDGTTVTWTTTYDTPLTLDATASATSSAFPDWIWTGLAWGAGILVALAVAGLITVGIRSRHDG
ncbi:LppM family (lipo)protein [Litorihabitans aurantiacus]|uniref:LppM domain-containing protein n=1 Tax=Litorihabitans aurantiacus TaxID=1930061 RepID=A0AA37XCQ7_9MICO|nr:hypothetical protein [Litorihabitans aurantiacus]GMA30118.1 hypothetical protein GCM10025875_01100 [Litorihabitans aurantiacus]